MYTLQNPMTSNKTLTKLNVSNIVCQKGDTKVS